MSSRLQGKKALITGSTSNIGRSIALAFGAQGAHVIVSGRDRARGEAVADRIRGDDGQADYVHADLDGTSATSRALAGAATERLGGRLDILVNNAGIYPSTTTLTVDDEAVVAKERLRDMRERSRAAGEGGGRGGTGDGTTPDQAQGAVHAAVAAFDGIREGTSDTSKAAAAIAARMRTEASCCAGLAASSPRSECRWGAGRRWRGRRARGSGRAGIGCSGPRRPRGRRR